jgi:transcriptional regulator with XRE-family HTH domain
MDSNMTAVDYAYPVVALGIPGWHYLDMDNLLTIRELKGITQQQLADAVGANQATISKIEKGIGNPTLAMINRIAKALGVHPASLFTLDPLRQRAVNAIDGIPDQTRKEAAVLVLESMAHGHRP